MGKIVFDRIGSSRAVTWGMRCLRAQNVELCRSHGAVLFECAANQNVQRLRPAEVGNYQSGLARGCDLGLRGSHLVDRLIRRGAHARVAFHHLSRGRRCGGILAEIDAPQDPEQEAGGQE